MPHWATPVVYSIGLLLLLFDNNFFVFSVQVPTYIYMCIFIFRNVEFFFVLCSSAMYGSFHYLQVRADGEGGSWKYSTNFVNAYPLFSLWLGRCCFLLLSGRNPTGEFLQPFAGCHVLHVLVKIVVDGIIVFVVAGGV